MGEKVYIKYCDVKINGNNNIITLGNSVDLTGLRISVTGDGLHIDIGDGTVINASNNQRTIISATGANISIGKNCLFSNSIEIHTSDYHSILDINGNRTNPDDDIHIGDHVWIGFRCILLGGTSIANDCIIGASSLLCKAYTECKSLIVGIPGKIIKHDITWNKDKI